MGADAMQKGDAVKYEGGDWICEKVETLEDEKKTKVASLYTKPIKPSDLKEGELQPVTRSITVPVDKLSPTKGEAKPGKKAA